jgi:Xaa-Pro aminopeptidase
MSRSSPARCSPSSRDLEKSLGIRIEDSVLVTADGCEILTAAAPKEIAEIESLMKEKPAHLIR